MHASHVIYEAETETLRQQPENYCLAYRLPDGYWYPAPNPATSINAHSLGLALRQYPDKQGSELAQEISRAFWGE